MQKYTYLFLKNDNVVGIFIVNALGTEGEIYHWITKRTELRSMIFPNNVIISELEDESNWTLYSE